jgi:hypothetical protein
LLRPGRIVTAFLTGYIAQRYGLRPAPFLLGIAYAAFGLILSILLVRDTRDHVGLEVSLHASPAEVVGLRKSRSPPLACLYR